jgi:hypothetical protein
MCSIYSALVSQQPRGNQKLPLNTRKDTNYSVTTPTIYQGQAIANLGREPSEKNMEPRVKSTDEIHTPKAHVDNRESLYRNNAAPKGSC